MARHRARQVAITALAIAATAGTGAQNAPQPAPTFRSEINFVQIPVRVLDARGDFVKGLTQTDFQIFEDGQPQAITAFSAVDIPSMAVDATVPDAPLASVDAVASNDPITVDGRVYVFVLDNQAMSPATALRTRHVVRGFVRDYLKANDVAAVVFTGFGRGQHFTRNRRLLNDAIERLLGDPDPTDDAAHRSLATIAETARSMAAIKGRRKALVLLSPNPICSLLETENGGIAGKTSSCREDARFALRAAVQSDVSIYTIDPNGLNTSARSRAENSGYIESNGVAARSAFASARSESRGPDDAARYLAEQSGGFAVVNTNSLSAGFERVAHEHSSYYLLGYYSTNNRADGKARRNEITVNRPGARVVHRASYLGPAPKADLKVGTTKTNLGIEAQLQELADNPLPVSTMALRVAAAPISTAAGKTSVSVVVEIPADTVKLTEAVTASDSRIRLSVGFYDRDGKSVGGEDSTIPVSNMSSDALRFVSKVSVPAGVYRLWVGAIQTPAGVRGSVMTDIEVPDFNRPRLALSGITVSDGGPPLANREFTADRELLLDGDIHDRRRNGGAVTAAVTVKSHDGRILYETPFERSSHQSGYRARIPLTRLAAGSYIATVEATSTTPKRESVTRSVAFIVR